MSYCVGVLQAELCPTGGLLGGGSGESGEPEVRDEFWIGLVLRLEL